MTTLEKVNKVYSCLFRYSAGVIYDSGVGAGSRETNKILKRAYRSRRELINLSGMSGAALA